jgi:hypothetical protein
MVVNTLHSTRDVDKAEQKEKGEHTLKYLINMQLKRMLVVALMVLYTYLQFKHIVPFNLLYLIILYVIGLLTIVVITSKIRIVSAHIEHCRKEGHNHHG